MNSLTFGAAVRVFLAFALAYFCSTLLRAVTATLSPVLTREFGLGAGALGLLAGAYFLGFAALQLPLGYALDRWGPRRVNTSLLAVAVLGCAVFALADGFAGLLLARVLMGVGVSAALMAPLTGYRRWFEPSTQLRANAWMLMTGAFGMLAATLPVQWLEPLIGWRWLFAGMALLILLTMLVLRGVVPAWTQAAKSAEPAAPEASAAHGSAWATYLQIARHPYFRQAAPLGLVSYGGMVAIQSLWAGPWMTRVAQGTALQAATGLFCINACMLLSFWLWGWAMPRLTARGMEVDRLVRWGLPGSYAALLLLVLGGARWGQATFVLWTLYCVLCTPAAQVQPVLGMRFPSALAGRALSAYNLVVFVGIFLVQWGIGLAVDGFKALGWPEPMAFQAALAGYGLLSLACYLHFVRAQAR